MVFRVEVGLRGDLKDPHGKIIQRRVKSDFNIESVTDVRVFKVYLIDVQKADLAQVKRFVAEVLTDPVTEVAHLNEDLTDAFAFDWLAEVGFLPGVTDNEGRTALWAFKTLFPGVAGEHDAVYAGRKYLLRGPLVQKEVERISTGLLCNKLIQRHRVIGRAAWEKGDRMGDRIPAVTEQARPEVRLVPLEIEDEALDKISKERVLALSREEMKAIQAYYRRPRTKAMRKELGFPELPTDCELEVIGQTWSEHCKHKIFSAEIFYTDAVTNVAMKIDSLFKSYIKKTTYDLLPTMPWVKSVFDDNAGVIEIDDGLLLAMKVETHNSPSALDPYGGALTGIVGVNRDIMGCGLGAKPIFNTDVFCFASPFYRGDLPGPNLLHPARIFRGVHQGVKDGGNESGIPVVNGSIFFDNRFIGKPLVFCGTGGLMPAEVRGKPSWQKKPQPGDLIVMTGGRVGKDGIHGATFSSEELHPGSPVTAVQIGDPIVQKRMTDFILEARDKGLYTSITDNGAGGLSSSIGEMATGTGGARINLEKVPLKYEGLQPWEIFVSEAQERMTLSVPAQHMAELQRIAAIHEVEMTAIGEFTTSGQLEIYHGKTPVALLDMEFLHDGLPKMKLEAVWARPECNQWDLPQYDDLNAIMVDMIGRLNIASKEEWVRQYDHEVQGRSAGKPFVGAFNDGPADAAVVRLTPFRKSACVVSHGLKPTFSDIDAYWMTASVIDEAVRNAVAVGGDPDFLAGLDNFCWPDPVHHEEKNPGGKEKLAALVRSNMALYDICTQYRIPLISGKDSMKNDYGSGKEKISVPPTLLFTLLSRMADVEKMVSMDFKNAGDIVYLVGTTAEEMGASEYFSYHGIKTCGLAPKVRPAEFLATYRKLHIAMKEGLVASAHDLSDGGLAVAVAESAFAGALGVKLDVTKVPRKGVIERDDIVLFSESNGRILVSVSPAHRDRFEAIMAEAPFAAVGEVNGSGFMKVSGTGGKVLISLPSEELWRHWKAPLEKLK